MADALVGIGADLSALTASLQSIPGIAGTEADKAIRKVQSMSIRASRNVSKAIKAQARENDRAQKAVERAAYRAASATEKVRLALLASERETMTASQRAASAMREELRALDALAAKGAEVAQVERARAAAIVSGARKIGAARAQEAGVSAPSRGQTAQMQAFAGATAGAAKSSSEFARAGQSVALQLPDVFSQLASGTPVMTIFIQQGLQVAQMNMGLVMRAAKAMAAAFSGPVLVAVGLVTGALALLYAAVNEQRAAQAGLEAALKRTAVAYDPVVVRAYRQATRDLAESVEAARLVLLQEAGALGTLEIAQMKAVEQTRAAGRASLLAARAQYVKLEADRIGIKVALESGELTFKQTQAAQARLKVLKEEAPAALKYARSVEAQIDAQAAQVNETYNSIAALKAARDAEAAADKARRRGTEGIREQADAQKARAAAIGKVHAALSKIESQQTRAHEAALSAAQEPFIDKSEIAVLGRLRDGLVEAANAARLTSEEALATQAALAQIDARIGQIRAAAAGALDPLTSQLTAVGELASTALDGMADEVEAAMSDIPWARVWGGAIVDTARDAGKKAAGVVSALTGGALSALASPADLLAEATKGAKGANAIADQAIDFVTSLAENIGPFIQALADRLPDIIVAIAEAAPIIVVEIVKAIPQIVKGLFVGIARGMVALAKTIARLVRNAVRDVVTTDSGRQRRRRRRVSDTPGPIRVDRETTVAPGDYLVAARSPAGLRAQMGGGASAGAVSVTTVLDVRDGPVRLGMAVSTRREVDRLGVGRNNSGRQGVY